MAIILRALPLQLRILGCADFLSDLRACPVTIIVFDKLAYRFLLPVSGNEAHGAIVAKATIIVHHIALAHHLVCTLPIDPGKVFNAGSAITLAEW